MKKRHDYSELLQEMLKNTNKKEYINSDALRLTYLCSIAISLAGIADKICFENEKKGQDNVQDKD